jgi:RNA polymerase sigma factor (sigma-70 family)
MKHEIECSFDPDIIWLGEINRQVLRLEREASVFPPNRTHLTCVLRQGGDRPAGVILTLRVGEEKLSSFAEDPSPVAATRRAFDKLRASLAAHVGERRREEFWGRTSRNLPAREAAPEPRSRREAAELIDRHLPDLYNFARREIAYRHAVGDLSAGDLTPEEVADEVALAAIERFEGRPGGLDFGRWLLQLVLDAVERRVAESVEERAVLHVEEKAAASPAEEVARAGDEIFDFYQPDEDVRLEDLIKDERVPTPEEALARRELQRHINRTLARLPRHWRTAFVLYAVEGLTLEEVARVARRPVDEVRRAVESARAFLRECLVDAGAGRAPAERKREEVAAL